MSLQILNNSDFKSTISSATKPVIIDFFATWCPPCKMLAPILDEIGVENENLIIYKVDIDESPEIAEEFGVQSVPTLVAFANGAETNRVVGAVPKEKVLTLIN